MAKNTHFSFKQFRIEQDQCAMKVCTDSCLFGAWVADRMKQLLPTAKTGVDIGTGTGLLSLMLAQQLPGVKIQGIEINQKAAQQAKANFKASPFTERLKIKNINFDDYDCNPDCDIVISNPPFYYDSLLSPNDARNVALHKKGIGLGFLVSAIPLMLKQDGGFGAILVPYFRTEELLSLVSEGDMQLVEKMYVRQTPKHAPFRTMVILSNEPVAKPATTQINVKNEAGEYSAEFEELLRDYYLAF